MKLQTVDTTGKPDWCPAMVLAEVWDNARGPNCVKAFVAWRGGSHYYVTDLGHIYLHAEPVLKLEPKPRSLVWYWDDKWDSGEECSVALLEHKGKFCRYIPACYEDGELEPAPTVAKARKRKEAEE